MIAGPLRKPGFWLLLAAFSCALAAALGLSASDERRLRNLVVVIDLTRSMTARDYGEGAGAISRLD